MTLNLALLACLSVALVGAPSVIAQTASSAPAAPAAAQSTPATPAGQSAPAAPAAQATPAAPAAAQPSAAPAAAAAASPPVSAGGDALAGQQKTQMCSGCHGIDGYRTAFPEVYMVPKIAGQHEVYFVRALQAYRSGERNHPSMRAIASSLSDKDMADLAAYYAKPSLTTAAK